MQQSTGFHVGSFLSWQIAEFFLASHHGGEGTVFPPCRLFHQLFRNGFVCFMGKCHSVFELSVSGISAKLQEWMEAAESCGLENSTGRV